jgi:hypothetical protein
MRVARPVDKIKYHAANQELNDVVVKPVLADIWAGKVTVPAGLKTLQPQIQAILDRYA